MSTEPPTKPATTLPSADNRQLSPVFSVMVAGHRQARLNRNHYPAESYVLRDALREVLDCIQTAAASAFAAGTEVYRDQPAEFRLVTGVEDGVDQMAAVLARREGFSLHLLAPEHVDDANPDIPLPDRGIAFGMHTTRHTDSALRQDEYNLRDRVALTASDLLVAVLDEDEPASMTSGTALVVKEALLRRKPVIWLALRRDGQPPECRLNDPAHLTESALAELQILGATPQLIDRLFHIARCTGESTAQPDSGTLNQGLQVWFKGLLTPFLDAANLDPNERQLRDRIARQPALLGFAASWMAWGWTMLTRQSRLRSHPMSLPEFLRGSVLWLRVMLDPPRRSPGQQILDYINTEPRALSWRESAVSRLHGFVSGLVKLNAKGAWHALAHPAIKEERASHRPMHAPIREAVLEDPFRWADDQATFFATKDWDDTWVIYYSAAAAVFCAVADAAHLWPASLPGWRLTWVILEFLFLRLVLGKVLVARFKGRHQSWMGYRYLSEQLRLLRLGLPLLVFPTSLKKPVWKPDPRSEQAGNAALRIHHPEAWLLQRIMMVEGLPASLSGHIYYRLTHHNPEILTELKQALRANQAYYANVNLRLHRDDYYLHRLSLLLFALTFFAVLMHLLISFPGILFFTAFLPAWGAAIHGLLNQNEVGRVAAIAARTWHKLETLDTAFAMHETVTESGIQTNDPALAWARTQELRALLRALIETIDEENHQWITLMSHHAPELPG